MRLIDADALRKEVTEKVHFMTVDGHIAYNKMLKLIDSAPPVPERPQGKWIDTGSGQECNVCHEIQYGYDNFRHFCANCGADMRKGGTEE